MIAFAFVVAARRKQAVLRACIEHAYDLFPIPASAASEPFSPSSRSVRFLDDDVIITSPVDTVVMAGDADSHSVAVGTAITTEGTTVTAVSAVDDVQTIAVAYSSCQTEPSQESIHDESFVPVASSEVIAASALAPSIADEVTTFVVDTVEGVAVIAASPAPKLHPTVTLELSPAASVEILEQPVFATTVVHPLAMAAAVSAVDIRALSRPSSRADSVPARRQIHSAPSSPHSTYSIASSLSSSNELADAALLLDRLSPGEATGHLFALPLPPATVEREPSVTPPPSTRAPRRRSIDGDAIPSLLDHVYNDLRSRGIHM